MWLVSVLDEGLRGRRQKFFARGVDYYPFLCLYSEYLVPSEGAARRALKCGDERDGGGGDARAQSGGRSGDIRPVGAVAGEALRTRMPAAQAAWSRRHYRGVTGGI